MSFSLNFPHAYGEPTATATFRAYPEDFIVDEVLGYEPAGEGEHIYLHIKKRGENTDWVARKIAGLAGVKEMDIGYCGRKDRHAVTTQWFSVYLPAGKPVPDWRQLGSETIELLSVSRHARKLRKGEHQANRFVIRLRDVNVDNKESFQQRLEQVLQNGVPNYYGEQRFGRNGSNLEAVEALLIDRKPIQSRFTKGMVLSAARSWIFNQVLAARVNQENWREIIAGESAPCASGPLWGRGRSPVSEDLLMLEQQALETWQGWCHGLEHQGLQQERRPLVLQPEESHWQWQEQDLEVGFSLGSGEFATAVLREIAVLTQAESALPASLEAVAGLDK